MNIKPLFAYLSACIFFFVIFVTYSPLKAIDFYPYYLAVKAFSAGYPVYNFDFSVIKQIAKDNQIENFTYHYYYPPLTAQIIWPLSFLSPCKAAWVWFILSLCAALMVPCMLYRVAGEASNRWMIFPAFFLFFPICISLLAGQVNLLLLFFISLAYYCLIHRLYRMAGISIVIGMQLKYVAFVYLYLLIDRKQWKELLITIAVGIFLFFSAFPLIGYEGYKSFFSMFVLMLKWNHSEPNANFCFIDLWKHCIPGLLSAQSLLYLRSAFSFFIILITIVSIRANKNSNSVPIHFAILTVSALLINPINWYHLYLVLIIPFTLIFQLDGFRFQKYGAMLLYCLLNLVGIILYTRFAEFVPALEMVKVVCYCTPFCIAILLWILLLSIEIIDKIPSKA